MLYIELLYSLSIRPIYEYSEGDRLALKKNWKEGDR